jgi:hypothetical protein
MTCTQHEDATWSGCMPFGIQPTPSPYSSHFMRLNLPPPPSILHLNLAGHTNWNLCGMGVFMAPCRGLPRSHLLQIGSPSPKAELGHSFPHSPPHNQQNNTSLVHLFFKFANSLWCDLHSNLILHLRSLSPGLPNLRVFPPKALLPLVMP